MSNNLDPHQEGPDHAKIKQYSNTGRYRLICIACNKWSYMSMIWHGHSYTSLYCVREANWLPRCLLKVPKTCVIQPKNTLIYQREITQKSDKSYTNMLIYSYMTDNLEPMFGCLLEDCRILHPSPSIAWAVLDCIMSLNIPS